MRAIVLRRVGGPEELELCDLPPPEPAAGEVLVRVMAEGVCGRDLIDRRGGFRGLRLPVVLGHEFAGEVVGIGPEVADLSLGDRVANLLRISCGTCASCLRGEAPVCERAWQSFGQTRDGGYAELVTAPAAALVKIPSGITDVEAAPAACTVGVALRALRTVGQVAPGENVLITGASGGVGMAAIQIAKVLGARVIAATSSRSKVAALLAIGADDVLVDDGGNLHEQLRSLVPAGVDAALELTGSPTFNSSLRSLRNGGRLVLVGNILAESIRVNPGAVILYGYQIRGSAGCTRGDLEDAFSLMVAGTVRMVISQVLPLEQAARAHELLGERGVTGRVVLTPRP